MKKMFAEVKNFINNHPILYLKKKSCKNPSCLVNSKVYTQNPPQQLSYTEWARELKVSSGYIQYH